MLHNLYRERNKLKGELEAYQEKIQEARDELRVLEAKDTPSPNDLERAERLRGALTRLSGKAMELQKRLAAVEQQIESLEAQRAQLEAELRAHCAAWEPLYPHLPDLERAIAQVAEVVGRLPKSAREEALRGVRILDGLCGCARRAKEYGEGLKKKLAWYDE